MVSLPKRVLLALVPFYLAQLAASEASGTGTTTRYWDCCKPSCAWPGKTTLASGANPVAMCDISDNFITDYNAVSGCESGGTAFMPSSESPWAVSEDLSYGYAAVNIAGGSESSWCCACYELTFTSGPVEGKKMIVQATNTGGDLGSNQFDLSIPGGGVGIYNGCTTEWGAPSSGWGAQYGGISSRSDCDSFPDALKDGCYWRFDWFQGADNPSVSFTQVTCPAALTAKTGCVRQGETPTGSSTVATYGTSGTASAASSASTKVASTSKAAAIEKSATTSASSTPIAVESSKAASVTPSAAESSLAGVETSSAAASPAAESSPAGVESSAASTAPTESAAAAGVESSSAIVAVPTPAIESSSVDTTTYTTSTTTETLTSYIYPGESPSSTPAAVLALSTTSSAKAVLASSQAVLASSQAVLASSQAVLASSSPSPVSPASYSPAFSSSTSTSSVAVIPTTPSTSSASPITSSSAASVLPTMPLANSTEAIVTVGTTINVIPLSEVTLTITDACPALETTPVFTPVPVTTVTIYTAC